MLQYADSANESTTIIQFFAKPVKGLTPASILTQLLAFNITLSDGSQLVFAGSVDGIEPELVSLEIVLATLDNSELASSIKNDDVDEAALSASVIDTLGLLNITVQSVFVPVSPFVFDMLRMLY